MKIKRLLFTAAGAFVMATLVALTLHAMRPKPPEPPPGDNLPEALVVYCFLSGERSAKCEKIEQQMHDVLKKSFAPQLKARKIVWQVVNYEEPENAYLAQKYNVTSTSIVVDDGRPGNLGQATNYQQKAWSLVDDKEAFANYFRGEIENALKQKPAER